MWLLFLKRIAARIGAYHPAEGVDEEEVLGCVDEAFFAVAGVEVYHAVFGVGPYDGEVAVAYHVFDAQRVVFGGER